MPIYSGVPVEALNKAEVLERQSTTKLHAICPKTPAALNTVSV
jgi:hypothetical protein